MRYATNFLLQFNRDLSKAISILTSCFQNFHFTIFAGLVMQNTFVIFAHNDLSLHKDLQRALKSSFKSESGLDTIAFLADRNKNHYF